MPSPRFLRAVTDAVAEDTPLYLLRLHCPDFPDWADITGEDGDFPADWAPNTMYFVRNTEEITSRGKTYLPWIFDLILPGQGEAGSAASLRFDNLDRRISRSILLLPSDAEITVTAETILAETPDIVEESFDAFKLNQVKFAQLTIDANLSPPDDNGEPACSVSYLPQTAPGLFR